MISLQIGFPVNADPNGSPLFFGIANAVGITKLVVGVRAVEQHFAKLLLTEPGTDPFNTTAGAGLSAITNQKVTPDNLLSLKNDLALAVMDVQNQILASQLDIVLDPSEILVSATPIVDYQDGVGWSIQVTLVVQSGNTAQILLGA